MSHNDSSISTREINKISRVSPYRNIMRDRLWLMEEQLENLISDLEEVQLKEDDEK